MQKEGIEQGEDKLDFDSYACPVGRSPEQQDVLGICNVCHIICNTVRGVLQ
jgi:hypothetical protein